MKVRVEYPVYRCFSCFILRENWINIAFVWLSETEMQINLRLNILSSSELSDEKLKNLWVIQILPFIFGTHTLTLFRM